MSGSLISNYDSDEQHRESILRGEANRVKVLVESECDVVVWYRLLSAAAPGKTFEVSPYAYDNDRSGKGKAGILKMASSFGQHFVGCVDSDFDWLLASCPSSAPSVAPFPPTPGILHTYAHAIENLALQPGAHADVMLDCVLHTSPLQRNLDADLQAFLEILSENVYEVLLWHLAMRASHIDDTEISQGRDHIFNNNHYAQIIKDKNRSSESRRNEILTLLGKRCREVCDRYAITYPALSALRDTLRQELEQHCGVTSTTAWLHVRGHDLFDFLINNFFDPVANELIAAHVNDIKASHKPCEITNATTAYKKQRKPFRRDILHQTTYINDPANPLTARIRTAISAALSE